MRWLPWPAESRATPRSARVASSVTRSVVGSIFGPIAGISRQAAVTTSPVIMRRTSRSWALAWSPPVGNGEAVITAVGLWTHSPLLTSQSRAFLRTPGTPCAYSGLTRSRASDAATACAGRRRGGGVASSPSRSGLKCGSAPMSAVAAGPSQKASAERSTAPLEERARRLPERARSLMGDGTRPGRADEGGRTGAGGEGRGGRTDGSQGGSEASERCWSGRLSVARCDA